MFQQQYSEAYRDKSQQISQGNKATEAKHQGLRILHHRPVKIKVTQKHIQHSKEEGKETHEAKKHQEEEDKDSFFRISSPKQKIRNEIPGN